MPFPKDAILDDLEFDEPVAICELVFLFPLETFISGFNPEASTSHTILVLTHTFSTLNSNTTSSAHQDVSFSPSTYATISYAKNEWGWRKYWFSYTLKAMVKSQWCQFDCSMLWMKSVETIHLQPSDYRDSNVKLKEKSTKLKNHSYFCSIKRLHSSSQTRGLFSTQDI